MNEEIEKKVLAIEAEHGCSVTGNLLSLQAMGEVMPTPEEFAAHTLADLSEPDNIRKLARIIAQQNDMETAADLTQELSYAYQHMAYDCASGARSMAGIGPIEGLKELLALLQSAQVSDGADIQKALLIGILEAAIRLDEPRP